MKLLDVKAVLDREKHIQQTDPEREVLKECDDETTSYAILSHRWGDGSEVGYKEMTGLIKMEEQKKDKVRKRDGYQKIIKSCEQAEKDGYAWVWIDTCCINKQSSSELSEAINSMYRWYQNAGVCYAYLNDVDESTFPTKRDVGNFPESNGWPEWFVRGWTLQELVAPKKVEFFNKDWVSIGNKWRLAPRLEEVTGIPCEVLKDGLAAERLSVAQIMSWAAERETTRVEDRAYSLMGLFGVNMPMLYGEGRKAFERLQLEIIRISSDQSIFAWNPQKPRSGSVLAEDPSDFRGCRKIKKLEPDEFVKELVEYIDLYDLGNPWHIWLNWHKISTNPIHWCRVAWLKRRAQSLSQQLHTFSVNSAGIQVCLPITPSRDSPLHFRAILACTENDGWGLATIDLVFSGSSYDKSFGITGALKTLPVFKTLYLTHHQDANETRREFTLDDKHALYHGFTRRGVYPRDFIGDTATLSSRTDDLIVVVYANDCAGSRFALGLGCYRGQGWMDVVYDDRLSAQGDFGKRAYDRMWSGRAKYQSMAEQRHRLDSREPFIKHVHLPRSIWAAKIIYRRWKEKDNFNVVLDVEQCAGCCDGPCQWSIAFIQWSSLDRPGIMNTHSYSYELQLDGCEAQFERCSGQWVALGDYGDYSCRTFTRTGNIFEDMRTLGINPMDSVYRPVVSRISSGKFATNHRKNWNDLVVANNSSEPLVLCEPKGLSLPANEHFALLLKALSTRAAGKTLVISVVQCSDFYRVDDDGKRIDDDKRRHSGDNCASDNGNDSTEPRILTPLCAVGRPQVWEKKSLCSHRWQQLGIIREHFYALVNMEFTGPEARHKSVNRKMKDEAIKFFSDMFGLQHLRNYVGIITFFERLPWMMETDSPNEVIVSFTEEHGLLARLFKGSRQPSATQHPCLEVVLPLLRERCRTFDESCDTSRRYAARKQKVTVMYELKSISQTLGAGLLKYIGITFKDARIEHESSRTGPASGIEYDRHLNTPSMVEEVKALQEKLNATEDEDEQRALAEDVTGKILWLCWSGICAEVDELLSQVVNYLQRENDLRGLRELALAMSSLIDPPDDPAHLQRIMFDAGAGTSKHQLLLDARAAEQAKWSGTTIPRGTTNTNAQGPSTSS